jgi:predicted NUDIX family NTP pyrophosphohydrolase
MVEDTGEFPFPEIDKFEWVKYEEAMKMIHYTQQELLKKLEDRLV